jgi:hypothetical protein
MTKHDWRGSLRKELCWLVAASVALGACGAGQSEAVKAPPPKKVMWNGSGSEPAVEEAEAPADEPEVAAAPPVAAEDEESVDDPNAIDLDALAAQQTKPAPAATPKPKAKPPAKTTAASRATARAAAKPAPEPVAEEAPAAEPEEQPEAKEAKKPDTKKAEAKPPDSAAAAVDPLALELQKRRAAAKARAEARAGKDEKSSAKKGEAAEAEEPAASAYKGSDPCRATSFSVDRVRSACANGGRAAAKRVMKDAIGKATATGQSLRCSNCHADQKDYALKADAVSELKRWLDGSGG